MLKVYGMPFDINKDKVLLCTTEYVVMNTFGIFCTEITTLNPAKHEFKYADGYHYFTVEEIK
jgi:hypothetical protein